MANDLDPNKIPPGEQKELPDTSETVLGQPGRGRVPRRVAMREKFTAGQVRETPSAEESAESVKEPKVTKKKVAKKKVAKKKTSKK